MLIDIIIKVYIDNDYLMTNIYSNNIYRSIRSVSGHIDPRETAVLICIYGYIRGVLHPIAIYNVANHGFENFRRRFHRVESKLVRTWPKQTTRKVNYSREFISGGPAESGNCKTQTLTPWR